MDGQSGGGLQWQRCSGRSRHQADMQLTRTQARNGDIHQETVFNPRRLPRTGLVKSATKNLARVQPTQRLIR